MNESWQPDQGSELALHSHLSPRTARGFDRGRTRNHRGVGICLAVELQQLVKVLGVTPVRLGGQCPSTGLSYARRLVAE